MMTQVTRKEKILGYHVLLEFHGCSPRTIEDSSKVEQVLLKAAKLSKAHIVDSLFHTFNPHGLSGIIVIAESHFAIHTWPEYRYAAIDLFSCSEKIDLETVVEYLKKHLKPKSVSVVELKRGMI